MIAITVTEAGVPVFGKAGKRFSSPLSLGSGFRKTGRALHRLWEASGGATAGGVDGGAAKNRLGAIAAILSGVSDRVASRHSRKGGRKPESRLQGRKCGVVSRKSRRTSFPKRRNPARCFAHRHAARLAPTAIRSTDSRCLWSEAEQFDGCREFC